VPEQRPRTDRHFIESAKHTLWLQNERYQDTVIIERLVRAMRRGVRVHILARLRTRSRRTS
jgi:phosphatidylserine/phosphatidylglycerophosphate/cardiolipin synthase-like enzyme